MDKAMTFTIDKNNITINIPNKIVCDVFENYNEGQLKLKDKKQFIIDFASSLQETIEDDDFMNDILDRFIYDVDYIEEEE